MTPGSRPRLLISSFSELAVGTLLLLGLVLTSLYSYILFHSLAELFSIVISWSVFLLAWNTRRFIDNGYLLFTCFGFLFVGLVDLVHTLAYSGMGVIPGGDSNIPTQLWIAARYLQSLTLLAAPFFIGRKNSARIILLGFALVTGLLLASILYWHIFPDCYVAGVGLTPFKKASEDLISLILLGALILLYLRRRAFEPEVTALLALSIIFSIASELTFTAYVSVYDFANLVGHLCKIVEFYLLYKAIVVTGLVKPYALIFRDLKSSEQALRAANERLEAMNKELESFSYSVSHDLRSPLTALDGYSQLLQESATGLDDKSREYIARIRGSVERMEQLIEDLLMLSRASQSELKKEDVDLAEIALEVSAELCSLEPGRRVEWIIPRQLQARGDPGLLQVLLQNLLGNAFKFTGRRAMARIELGRQEGSGDPTYFVRDNGEGFDPAQVSRLFTPFQRLHSTRDFPGTGLGLATVKRIVDRHGGRVWAEGQVGKGATFYFTLP